MIWRILRITFTTISAASLLLFAGTLVLGVRGYFIVIDEFQYVRPAGTWPAHGQNTWSVQSGRGQLAFSSSWNNADGEIGQRLRWYHDRPPAPITQGNTAGMWFGFAYFEGVLPITPTFVVVAKGVVVPIWFALLVTGMLPTLACILRTRRQRLAWRLANGMCVRCGYDLRGSPDRCSECGAQPAHSLSTVMPLGDKAVHATT